MKKTVKCALVGIMAIWVIGVFVSFAIMEYRIVKECRDDRGMIVGAIYCPRTTIEKFSITILLKSFVWPLDALNYFPREKEG